MDYEGGTLPPSGVAYAGGRATAQTLQNLCMQAVGGGLSGLADLISDERIRGVYTCHCAIQIDGLFILVIIY